MVSVKRIELGPMRVSGNQSIVRGAIEAGVRVTSGYPGAPISDLQGTFEQLAGKIPRRTPFTEKLGRELDKLNYGLIAKWGETTNEDNAIGYAIGSTICKGDKKKREFISEKEWDLIYGDTLFGKDEEKMIPVGSRVMCSFKHLGGNTGADALRTCMNVIPYTGGLAIASGDDRQGTASQTMQDNKALFAFHFRMPTFELHSPRTAHTTVRNAYRLFEELGTPFAVISNYDLSYREVSVYADLSIDLATNYRKRYFSRDPKFTVTIGPHIRPQEKRYWNQLLPLLKRKVTENFKFLNNEIEISGERPAQMVVLNGPFREDFNILRFDKNLASRFRDKYGDAIVVKTDLVYPFPDGIYEDLLNKYPIEAIFIFEEGYSKAIYLQMLDFLNTHNFSIKVKNMGIPYEPRIYERFSYIDHILQ